MPSDARRAARPARNHVVREVRLDPPETGVRSAASGIPAMRRQRLRALRLMQRLTPSAAPLAHLASEASQPSGEAQAHARLQHGTRLDRGDGHDEHRRLLMDQVCSRAG
jgi:hypothetical protein